MNICQYILCFLLLLVFSFEAQSKNYIKPTYCCTIKIPNEITPRYFFIFDTSKCIVIPYGRLQAVKLLMFDLNGCNFLRYIPYPDEAKYLFIPSTDSTFWNLLSNPFLFCYDFYFSFRQIYPDMNNGKLYAFLYSLFKTKSDSLPFKPQKIIYRIDTSLFFPYLLKSAELTLAPLGFTPIKGDSLVVYGFKKGSFDTISQEYICLYNFKKEKLQYLLNLNNVKDFNRNRQWEIAHTYFIDDSLIVFYKYGQTLPFLYCIKNSILKRFNYKGLLKPLNKSNYIIKKRNARFFTRIFMHKFLPSEKYIVVAGGKNGGSKHNPLKLSEVCIQCYLKTNLKLIKEYLFKIPNNKQYSYFDCFALPTNKLKVFLFFLTNYNSVDIYSVDIR